MTSGYWWRKASVRPRPRMLLSKDSRSSCAGSYRVYYFGAYVHFEYHLVKGSQVSCSKPQKSKRELHYFFSAWNFCPSLFVPILTRKLIYDCHVRYYVSMAARVKQKRPRRREAGRLEIRPGRVDVDFPVRAIQVARQDDGFLGLQGRQVRREIPVPLLHAIVYPLEPLHPFTNPAPHQILHQNNALHFSHQVFHQNICTAFLVMILHGKWTRCRTS